MTPEQIKAIKAIEDKELRSCIRGVEEFGAKAGSKIQHATRELLQLSMTEKNRRTNADRDYWMDELATGFRRFMTCRTALQNASRRAWHLEL